MTTPPRAPEVPGYAILGLLGTGGLGSVWRARTAAGAIVALKVVEPRRPVDAATADRLFRREALAGLNLDHPGIVRALDAVKARDGRPCIVFELAGGPTLRDAVKARGAIPPEEVLRIASRLAAALDHAHRHGVVHGDLSPGNVLLSPGGARLLDFGLVAELEAEPGGSVFATPGFTAPEVMSGGAPTAASDLHALGKTLAFALQGADHPLRAVVERLCRADPAARYRSAAELGLDLDAIAAGETPLGAALSGAKARMAARRTGPWILAAVAVAAVAGSLLLRDRPPAPVPPPPAPRAPAPDPLAGKVEALRVLLGREPVDFGAARSLAAEIRGAGRQDPVLAEFDAKWKEASAALDVRKHAEARAALSAGDREAWKKALLEWPGEFIDSPEAAAARAEVERGDEAAMKAALTTERQLLKLEERIRSLQEGSPNSVAELGGMDAELKELQENQETPPDQRRRAGELRAKAGAKSATALKYAKEREIRLAVRAFLESAAKPEAPAKVQERLVEAIRKAEGTATAAALEDLRNGAQRAEVALARALERLEGRPWAAVIDEKLFVGIVETAPTTEAAFIPLWKYPDALSIVPDREDLSSWLATRGATGMARFLGPPGSPVARALPEPSGYLPYPERKNPPDMLIRVPKPEGPFPDRPKENPAKGTAVEAYLADDPLGAWHSIQEALRVDYRDAEIHVLAARVLMALSKPLATHRIRRFALEEAMRACEFDRSLHSARLAVIEIALPMEEEEFRFNGDKTGLYYLGVVLQAMEASVPMGRETPEGFVVLAEKLHRSGQNLGAKLTLEYARRLHATLPPWAEEFLR